MEKCHNCKKSVIDLTKSTTTTTTPVAQVPPIKQPSSTKWHQISFVGSGNRHTVQAKCDCNHPFVDDCFVWVWISSQNTDTEVEEDSENETQPDWDDPDLSQHSPPFSCYRATY